MLPDMLAADVVGDRDPALHGESSAQARCGGATRARGNRRAQQERHANRRREPSHWPAPICSDESTPLTLPTWSGAPVGDPKGAKSSGGRAFESTA